MRPQHVQDEGGVALGRRRRQGARRQGVEVIQGLHGFLLDVRHGEGEESQGAVFP
jgi:hypothetical protein